MPRQTDLLDEFGEKPSTRSGPPYSIIYADPPWKYRDEANAGERGAVYKYEVMSFDEIKDLPVGDIADENCALFLWVTAPLLPECLPVVGAWGFEYKTVAFTWVKYNSETKKFAFGGGAYTRANPEFCVLGLRGKLARKDNAVRSEVLDRRREHSTKPDIVRSRIVRLFGDLPRIELFARKRVEGWDGCGDDLEYAEVKLVDKRRFVWTRVRR